MDCFTIFDSLIWYDIFIYLYQVEIEIFIIDQTINKFNLLAASKAILLFDWNLQVVSDTVNILINQHVVWYL